MRYAASIASLLCLGIVAHAQPPLEHPPIEVAPGAFVPDRADDGRATPRSMMSLQRLSQPLRQIGHPSAEGFRAYLWQIVYPEEVERIVVDRYWEQGSIKEFRSQDDVIHAVRLVWEANLDGVGASIMWSEGGYWSIEATLFLKTGKTATLRTDGWHSALDTPDGYRWFFRGGAYK